MCRAVTTIHFGCDENHTREELIRCKAGLEYQLDMPIKDTCNGVILSEAWVMSPCRFCEGYLISKKRSGRRTRAASFAEGQGSRTAAAGFRGSGAREEPVTYQEKKSLERTFSP